MITLLLILRLVSAFSVIEQDLSQLSNESSWVGKALAPSSTTWRTLNGTILHDDEPFYIRGINLNGFESRCGAPLGLWDHSVADYLDIARSHEFNSIRVPLPYEAMQDLSIHVSDCVGADHNLRGGMQVGDLLQYILDEAYKRQIFVLIDLHTIGGKITPDPWTSDVSEDRVIEAWVKLMQRFGTHKALFAVEIKNEPHGLISMPEFATHCGKVICNIDHYVPAYQGLYVISGVEYKGSAWGGSFGSEKPTSTFQGLEHPNGLCLAGHSDRYILNPHIYGPDVRGEGTVWEAKGPTPAWHTFYGFLRDTESHWKHAVILPTEYGGFMKPDSPDRAYFESWLDWHLGQNYTAGGFMWTLDGRFSSDTGGLLEDGKTINQYKLEFAKRLTPNPTFSYKAP